MDVGAITSHLPSGMQSGSGGPPEAQPKREQVSDPGVLASSQMNQFAGETGFVSQCPNYGYLGYVGSGDGTVNGEICNLGTNNTCQDGFMITTSKDLVCRIITGQDMQPCDASGHIYISAKDNEINNIDIYYLPAGPNDSRVNEMLPINSGYGLLGQFFPKGCAPQMQMPDLNDDGNITQTGCTTWKTHIGNTFPGNAFFPESQGTTCSSQEVGLFFGTYGTSGSNNRQLTRTGWDQYADTGCSAGFRDINNFQDCGSVNMDTSDASFSSVSSAKERTALPFNTNPMPPPSIDSVYGSL